MLNGITILSTSTMNDATKNHWLPLSILFLLLAIIILVFIIYKAITQKNNTPIYVFILIEIFSLFLGITLLLSSIHPYIWKVYTVKISDSVSLKQFNKEYHIVSQTGDTYVIVNQTDSVEYQ
jgi:cytochrome bd-type quinol oxidase subunit 2